MDAGKDDTLKGGLDVARVQSAHAVSLRFGATSSRRAPADPVSPSQDLDLNSESSDTPPSRRQRISALASVLFAGIAILSDGYNGAIVGNVELILLQLYPVSFTSELYTRTSNAFLIGEVFGASVSV